MPRAAGDSRTYDWYLNGDKSLPQIHLTSVTTLIHDIFGANQYIVDWAANNFKDSGEMKAYREQRSQEGMAAHEFAERWVSTHTTENDITKPVPVDGYQEAWVKFVKENEPIITHSETIVYSLKHAYAGTLDLGILDAGGDVRVVDIKTKGAKIYKAYETELIQCRLYAMAAHEMGLIKRPDGPTGVVILKPNGRYTWDEREVSVEACEQLLALHQSLRSR